MSASIYNDKAIQPDDSMLRNDLAESYEYYEEISQFINNNYGNLSLDWKFYSGKSGWILKLLTKSKNVLFVIPCEGYFKVAFTFGEKATDFILNSDFSEFVKTELLNAKKHVEGRTIQLDISKEFDCDNVLKLIEVKLR